ncbi:Zn(II)2Cys6 transcription factor domain-containing protein [Aspergillus foveolatus]|uniref:Zn(II)2Cys6 transcription factor domain-containing protein n=1 Tax=Aspergillus foveolatus TaxID=210207 RepID=UPI003CCCBBE0
MTGHQSGIRPRTKGGSRSRKGCPECRSRKIKCDEQTPQCAQCLKTGRVCRIVDSLFKPHSYTFLAQTSPKPKSRDARSVRAEDKDADEELTRKTNPLNEKDAVAPKAVDNKPNEARTHPPNHDDRALTAETMAIPPLPECVQTERVSLASTSKRPEDATNQAGETYHDRCEIAFFLRHFCEGPGQWMDLCTDQSYFSQNALAISHRSPLVRYAACALAAKQLGQTRHPESHIRQTDAQRSMLKALIDTKLGFTWYGAKYYEKAIQLLAQQLSSRDGGTYSRSPGHVYGVETPSRQHACENDEETYAGILSLTIDLVVTQRKTRADPDDIVLWCKMGLPVDAYGNLLPETRHDGLFETILFKALIRLMCRLVNSDLGSAAKWTLISEEFDRWQGAVPLSFYIPITWPSDGPNPGDSIESCSRENTSRETWFANDICAMTVAFYHMSRIILLANCPNGIVVRQHGIKDGLIATFNALQQELRKHALEIMAIVHAMPSERVQKYMLQPLYVAGRHLTDPQERSGLLQILRNMGDDFGLFTDYRIRDLCDEWGMECSGIDRRDGYGIWT